MKKIRWDKILGILLACFAGAAWTVLGISMTNWAISAGDALFAGFIVLAWCAITLAFAWVAST